VKEQAAVASRRNAVHEAEMRTISRDFLNAVQEALNGNAGEDVRGAGWSRARDLLSEVSATRAVQGHSPSETAMFVFSLKQPLFTWLRRDLEGDSLAQALWVATIVIDRLDL